MFYLDDDLKNDTIQFDLAIERFKINSDYIDKSIEQVMCTLSDSLYDVENFCMDNETRTTLGRRFPNLFWNVSSSSSASAVRTTFCGSLVSGKWLAAPIPVPLSTRNKRRKW